MLLRWMWVLAAVAALVTACGGDPQASGDDPQTPASAAPAPTADPGAFPDQPQFLDDFSDQASGWPSDVYIDGEAQLPAGDQTRAAAPVAIEPGQRGTLLETEVTLGEVGAAGLFCRGSPRGGYEFLLEADGAWSMLRVEGADARVLDGGQVPDGDLSAPGQPTLLRLVCGAGGAGETVSLGFTVNATTMSFVGDPDGLPTPATSEAGVVVEDNDSTARFDNFALWLAEPG